MPAIGDRVIGPVEEIGNGTEVHGVLTDITVGEHVAHDGHRYDDRIGIIRDDDGREWRLSLADIGGA